MSDSAPTAKRARHPIRLALGRAYRRSFLNRLAHPRRLHLYGIGTGKSGTVSLAGLFQKHYRAEHEPAAARSQTLALAHMRGGLGDAPFRRAVLDLERDLWLEVNVAYFNIHFLPVLVDAFPESKFVLTVREPASWVRSVVDMYLHLRETSRDRTWKDLVDERLRTTSPHPPEEQPLAEVGLPPLEGFLNLWTWHNRTALETVPPERLFVLRTHDIGKRLDELAHFAGIDPATLDAASAHLHKAPARFGVIERIDPAHRDAQIRAHCGDLPQRLGLSS
ncbi:MAG: hypothetical protein KF858_07485 [Candidatus Sumerlaeia bacterium]|nr:hypothetical protein [Candidatus Sumerlaeia bacterium]